MIYYRIITDFGACGAVSVNGAGIITRDFTAPIFSKFIGQSLDNLRRWRRVVVLTEIGGQE